MKRLLILSALVITSFVYKAADAQVRVNVNIGNQPEWGPYGYDRAEYYYLPDIDVYYHVPSRMYTYLDGRAWVSRNYLPVRYRNYDLYRGYKVVVNDRNPWLSGNDYRNKYANYRNRYDQRNIRDYRYGQVYARNNERRDYRNDRRDDRDDRRDDHRGDNQNDDHRYEGNDKNNGQSRPQRGNW
ncbi:hypothetical protein [Hufsiella ginkgonis]|uniref:hypothetical protein n=1 Tax=Hufsiella ginkgonis TaxID=2695274 RepID=UPI0019296398|nr:hypothetical protein [Hufsiella ginkgonis]